MVDPDGMQDYNESSIDKYYVKWTFLIGDNISHPFYNKLPIQRVWNVTKGMLEFSKISYFYS